MATRILQQHQSPAVEQLNALSKLCEALSYESGDLENDGLVMAMQAVSGALAAEMAKPKADARKLASVADAMGTVLRFASESSDYKTGDAGGDVLEPSQREALASCASMAEIAAELCREGQ